MKRQSLRGKLSEQPDLHVLTAAAMGAAMDAAMDAKMDAAMDAAMEAAPAPLLIRPAAEQDIVGMMTLLAQTGRPRPTPDQVPAVAAIYREWLGQASALARVAERQDQVVGVLLGALRPRANWLTPELWIADMAIADGEAGEVGHDLLAEALAVAARWGCFRVACEAAGLTGVTLGLLSDLGFAENGQAVSLLLAPIPSLGTRGVRSADGAHDGVPITYRESSV
ncbi:MAG: hypothetical protein WAV74_01945 [Anaerolineae bacterium]